ncbi:MAG: hydroxyacid dehydrogenase [Actinobacteria bacterium]|nr:hydroxyacid dehydrogenase [Actinomycetota bacterium]
MRILVADAFEGVEQLRQAGHDVRDEPGASPADLAGLLDGVEVLVVRSTRVDADTVASADELSLIVRAGAGTNTIDTDAAAARGVYVCNTPGRNAIAVAELALGLLLAIDRRIPENVADLRAGRWDKRRYSQARGIAGRSLAIVGAGDIGLAFAERAVACDMRVRTVDKAGRDAATRDRIARIGIELVEDLPTLLAGCDVVSLHVPAAPGTEGMVDEEFLSHLKPGAWLLNTSRGSIVDEDALLAAIEEKDLRVGLDVYRGEPDAKEADGWEHSLAQHPNVVGTHHIGASTEQAQQAIADATLEVIEAYARGEVVNCVNLATTALGSSTLVVRHFDRVGALSSVFDVLQANDINVEQMDNEVFAGAVAAVATMRVSAGVTDAVLDELRDLDAVISASSRDGDG